MDTTNQGRSRNILLNGSWSIPCSLFDDELLSSWLVRSALANGCDPMTLTGYVWPGWRPWTIDIDRGLPNDKGKTLARLCATTTDTFNSIALSKVAGRLTNARLTPNNTWPWILPLGTRNRYRNGGLQFCPSCLEEDVPYFRIQWRLGWHTCCAKHKTLLISSCSHCALPVEPHRLESNHNSIVICPSCNNYLSSTEVIESPKAALHFQNKADEAFNQGYYIYSNEKLDAPDWFELARFFVLFIKRMAHQKTPSLVALTEYLGFKNLPTHSPQIELADPETRAKLLGCVGVFLRMDKETLSNILNENSISRQGLCPKGVILPDCLDAVAYSLVENPSVRTPKVKSLADLPMPRPWHEVNRRAIRINRRIKAGNT